MASWYDDVELFDRIEEFVPCIVESPMGSKVKYRIDEQTGVLLVDHVLYSAVHYPANYGFIPRTIGRDGDPLDVLVLGQECVVPACLLRGRAIGAFGVTDPTRGAEDKILAVHIDDPDISHIREISELPPHRLQEIERFFLDYKALENKRVDVGRFRGRVEALQVIREAARLYRDRGAEPAPSPRGS
jgi:inorganic pyrophosphatase